jgi:hypothetical protein
LLLSSIYGVHVETDGEQSDDRHRDDDPKKEMHNPRFGAVGHECPWALMYSPLVRQSGWAVSCKSFWNRRGGFVGAVEFS